MCVCVCVCVCVRVCVCVFCSILFIYLIFILHVKALLKASSYMIIWFHCNIMPMDVVNVVMFYLVIISDATNEFLPGGNKDLLNTPVATQPRA